MAKRKTLQKITSPQKLKVKPTIKQRIGLLKGKIIQKIRRDKKGRYNDREYLSNEKHEMAYVKRVARSWADKLSEVNSRKNVQIKAGQLRRLVEYILK